MARVQKKGRGKRERLRELAESLAGRENAVRLTGLKGGASAVVGAELIRACERRPMLFLTSNSKEADSLANDLRVGVGVDSPHAERLTSFPRHDTLPYDRFSPQPFVIAQRMEVLYRWISIGQQAAPPIAISTWGALALRVPSRDAVRARTAYVEIGQTIDRDALVEKLVSAGYGRMPLVEERGELAVRGGIVDIFPPHRAHPIRIELFGDEVESIRAFDQTNQRSLEKLSRAAIPPPREILLERDIVVERSDDIRELAFERETPEAETDELLDALLRGHLPPGVESIASLLQPSQESVFDYLPDDTLIVCHNPSAGLEHLAEYYEAAAAHWTAAQDAHRISASPEHLLVPEAELASAVAARNPVALERLDIAEPESEQEGTERSRLQCGDQESLRRALARTRTHDQALAPLADQIATWCRDDWRVVLACSALSGADRLRDLLRHYGLEASLANDTRPVWRWSRPGRVEVRVARIGAGFALDDARLAVVTEEEIFGPRERRHRQTADTWAEGTALDGLAQLSLGDYVVHADHGIGVYRGLIELEAGAIVSELLCLEYLGNDKLFLPVHRLNRIQRYGGADGVKPRIDQLGGQTWEKAKGRVRKSLRNMAQELLAVHAARELAPGYGFSPRDAYYEEFEATFDFEETLDQHAAIEDVLADMQRPKPMDRLVCGDVGYGKTEVAIRAAFRAALDGKQVAVLVPTTVLCQQHYETFEKRFAAYPIKVDYLSRFRTPAGSRGVLEGLVSGDIDVVVGTHRLLQKSVQFRDLGLLVVDEEQRFGVGHKERIKKIKKTVDVLTLTATPIPRTLQMAFTGVRDLSVINTPPADRYAIRTQVCRWSDSLIREAILREVRRGGQVFFLHNRVRTIGTIEETLARIVPEVKVLIAHGQMKERDLENRMHSFLAGEADVLLCTTIIESGLDIPRANTIIINRAHALGLAQLYQLRGRVGRSTHRAYAYLVVPPEDALSSDAMRRLEAIQDLTELGSGFRLANMDLEIRGAGDLLGSVQSGNLMSVGYETYMELLSDTIEELRGRIRQVEIDPEIRLPVSARLPEDYVGDVSQRLVLYKRLAGSVDADDVARIRDELLDRYGPLPVEAQNLLQVIGLKIKARALGIMAVDMVRGEIVLTVAESTQIDPHHLVNALTQAGSDMRVTPDHKIYGPAPPNAAGPDAMFDAAHTLLGFLRPKS